VAFEPPYVRDVRVDVDAEAFVVAERCHVRDVDAFEN
jgi:hypothetical protein